MAFFAASALDPASMFEEDASAFTGSI